MRTILDTGPLVALMTPGDRWHQWASSMFKTLRAPFITCEAVLTEVAHLTRRPADVMELITDGALEIGLAAAAESHSLQRLLRRHGERMDLADACVVRLSELHRRAAVFTIDERDFTVYRRNGREVIPLITPSGG